MKEKHLDIVFVEIGNSHEECLLTQVVALKNHGCNCTLICNEEIKTRNPHFEQYFNLIVTIDAKSKSSKELAKLVWTKIKEVNPAKVIFNTAQGSAIRNLAIKGLFSKMEFIGIIHTTLKIKGSFTQRLIDLKIRKYLLLSEFLYHSVESIIGKKKFEYFYPILFHSTPHTKTSDNGTQIGIIGGVEVRRKDLEGFFELVKATDEKVHFSFIGRSNTELAEVQKFIADIKSQGIEKRVTISEHFVSQEEFDTQVQQLDFILPLVHPNTPSEDQYFKNQISGAVNVALGYQIPLLIHEAYKHVDEIKLSSAFYRIDNFNETLQSAIENRKSLMENISRLYSKEEQEERYAKFILG